MRAEWPPRRARRPSIVDSVCCRLPTDGEPAPSTEKMPVSLKSITGRQPDQEALDRGAHPMSQFWWMFARFDGVAGRQLLGELEKKKKTREQESYERMRCHFQHPCTDPKRAEEEKTWWKQWGLKSYCRLVGMDNTWLQEELALMEACENTFGPHEMHYEGPKLDNTKTSAWRQESLDELLV